MWNAGPARTPISDVCSVYTQKKIVTAKMGTGFYWSPVPIVQGVFPDPMRGGKDGSYDAPRKIPVAPGGEI